MENSRKTNITLYETELIGMLQSLNEQMVGFAEKDMMSEGALLQLSATQQDQFKKMKQIFRKLNEVVRSDYYKKRCATGGNSLSKKRITEKDKRDRFKQNPELWHRCDRCDSIFANKFKLKRHQGDAIKCPIIKNAKKGAMEKKGHRGVEISHYISDHLHDVHSDEEVELNEDETAESENFASLQVMFGPEQQTVDDETAAEFIGSDDVELNE